MTLEEARAKAALLDAQIDVSVHTGRYRWRVNNPRYRNSVHWYYDLDEAFRDLVSYRKREIIRRDT